MTVESVAFRPRGRLAVELVERWRGGGRGGLLYIGAGERVAEHLGANIYSLARDCPVMVLPSWDCLPYDPQGPSREVMGRRMSVLRRLAEGIAAPLVIATPEAALQRVPPRRLWPGATLRLRVGERLDVEQLRGFLQRAGYRLDALVDEPGEAALHGQVIDVFPAGALEPVRLEHEDGRISGLHSYETAEQRTLAALDEVVLDPASESVSAVTETSEQDGGISPLWLCDSYPQLETVFDFLPEAHIVLDTQAKSRAEIWLEQIAEAYHEAMRARDAAGNPPPVPERLFLSEKEWRPLAADNGAATADQADEAASFAVAPNPTRAYRDFIGVARERGDKVVFAGADARDLKTMTRRAGPAVAGDATRVEGWQDVADAPPGSTLALQVDFDAGFRVPADGITVIAAADLLGSRAGHEVPMAGAGRYGRALGGAELAIGDAVIHLDHGLGLLRGIETVAAPPGPDQDTLRLEYAGGAMLLLPIGEIGKLWRYGGAAEGISLDRLGGEAWSRRRAAVEVEIRDAAAGLVAERKRRQASEAPKLSPPRRDYERLVAGFPFVATVDQARTADEVLADLASGHPMDRLVCGDVGFGKTEIALRAAAAAVLSGAQVAVVAPTTVLVRQHIGTFRRRFSPLGIDIGSLSRLTAAGEAREVKKALADGSLPLVIGTQAVAGKGIRFERLGLLIIDEEQRFGAATKEQLRGFADGLHVLTLTATPIPRTLQRAMVGAQSLSVLETPPARRRPVATVIDRPRADLIRDALALERRRGGQSFVVCPRIEDLEPVGDRLHELVPELTVTRVHGRMPAAAIDEAMVGFADGAGDVLLATNIIESGLDLPRANTILIWHPERFGTAQLHQLRGRVGRGRRRGFAYLLSEGKLGPAAQKRLRSLADLDRLGAGFALSERDMDLRGAGDIVGEKQAGHVRLVGVELYRRLLTRAVDETEGAAAPEGGAMVNLGVPSAIPGDYVADPELRINLYLRLARLSDPAAIDAFASELEDRFGALPPETEALIELARIREAARRLGAERLDAGPQAIAMTFTAARAKPLRQRLGRSTERRWDGDRLICETPSGAGDRARITLDLLANLTGE